MRDAIGNELKVGDLVQLSLAKPMVFGRVAAIKEGGIIHGIRKGGEQITPGELVIVCNHTMLVDPSAVAGSVLALRESNPPGDEAIEELKRASSGKRIVALD